MNNSTIYFLNDSTFRERSQSRPAAVRKQDPGVMWYDESAEVDIQVAFHVVDSNSDGVKRFSSVWVSSEQSDELDQASSFLKCFKVNNMHVSFTRNISTQFNSASWFCFSIYMIMELLHTYFTVDLTNNIFFQTTQ